MLALGRGTQDVRTSNIRRVVFYPEFKIAYNRIAKSGNSSVLLYLYDAMAGGIQGDGETYNACKREATAAGIDLFQLTRDWDRVLSLRKYVFFTVVRNPWSRTLSAFLDKVAKAESDKYAMAAGYGDDSVEGFVSFLRFLDNGGLHVNHHWRPQSALLLLPKERFDHVCRLEALADDLPRALAGTGLVLPHAGRLRRPHPIEASRAGKITQATERMRHYYTNEALDLVSRMYASDFRLGGYSDDPRSIGLA